VREALLAFARKRLTCHECLQKARQQEEADAAKAREEQAAAVRADPCAALETCGVDPKWRKASFESCPDIPADVLDVARRWAAEPAGFLFLSGIPGCGKTWLAVATLLEVMRTGVRPPTECRAVTERQYLAGLKRSFGDAAEATVVRGEHRAARVPMLLYDDLASARLTDWSRPEVAGLFEARHGREFPTIVTSNLDLGAIASAMDARTSSRLGDGGLALVLPARDLRMRGRLVEGIGEYLSTQTRRLNPPPETKGDGE